MTADGMHMRQSCLNVGCASFIGGALELLAERLLKMWSCSILVGNIWSSLMAGPMSNQPCWLGQT